MDRKAARQLAETTLTGLGTFEAVLHGPPDAFSGRSPVAVITSRSLRLEAIARSLYEVTVGITVSIYVRKDDDAEAAEDQLDDLALTVAAALHATGQFQVLESSAGPESGNLRDVDRNGVLYRVERMPLVVLDEGSDE